MELCTACGKTPFHYHCARSAAYWEEPFLAPALCEPCLLEAIVIDKRFSMSNKALLLAKQARTELGLKEPSSADPARDSTYQRAHAGGEQMEHPKPAFDPSLQKRRRRGDLLEGTLGGAGGSQEQRNFPFSSSASAPTVVLTATEGSVLGQSSGTHATVQATGLQQQGTCLGKPIG